MLTPQNLSVHNIIEHSAVNGPGIRFVIWTQGCPLNCAGCFNQATHTFDGGTDMSIEKLATTINHTKGIRGVTFSGGEPLIQSESISKLLSLIDKKLDILLFSGYSYDEIKVDSSKMNVLHQVDAALLGRYNQCLSHPFYGKKLIMRNNRISKDDMKPWLGAEIIINNNSVQFTGLY